MKLCQDLCGLRFFKPYSKTPVPPASRNVGRLRSSNTAAGQWYLKKDTIPEQRQHQLEQLPAIGAEGRVSPAPAEGQPYRRGWAAGDSCQGKVAVCLQANGGVSFPDRSDTKSITHHPLLPWLIVCIHFCYLIDYKLTRNPKGAFSLCWGSCLVGGTVRIWRFCGEMYSEWPGSGWLCDA